MVTRRPFTTRLIVPGVVLAGVVLAGPSAAALLDSGDLGGSSGTSGAAAAGTGLVGVAPVAGRPGTEAAAGALGAVAAGAGPSDSAGPELTALIQTPVQTPVAGTTGPSQAGTTTSPAATAQVAPATPTPVAVAVPAPAPVPIQLGAPALPLAGSSQVAVEAGDDAGQDAGPGKTSTPMMVPAPGPVAPAPTPTPTGQPKPAIHWTTVELEPSVLLSAESFGGLPSGPAKIDWSQAETTLLAPQEPPTDRSWSGLWPDQDDLVRSEAQLAEAEQARDQARADLVAARGGRRSGDPDVLPDLGLPLADAQRADGDAHARLAVARADRDAILAAMAVAALDDQVAAVSAAGSGVPAAGVDQVIARARRERPLLLAREQQAAAAAHMARAKAALANPALAEAEGIGLPQREVAVASGLAELSAARVAVIEAERGDGEHSRAAAVARERWSTAATSLADTLDPVSDDRLGVPVDLGRSETLEQAQAALLREAVNGGSPPLLLILPPGERWDGTRFLLLGGPGLVVVDSFDLAGIGQLEPGPLQLGPRATP
jgi:hypothetical protein